jgi:ferrous iron transport protein A
MSLAQAPIGAELRVLSTGGPPDLTRRLAELGLRPGSHVRCVQRCAGGGRVVDVAGSRIALGREVLASVVLGPLGDPVAGPHPSVAQG